MCENDSKGFVPYEGVTRRNFNALAVAGATVGAAGAAQAAAVTVVEREVNVRTPAGVSDSMVFYPEGRGQWPGVLLWPDILGRRAAMHDMGKRLASSGYVVLVVNPFYRSGKAPVVPAGASFTDPATREKLFAMRAAMGGPEGAAVDAKAYVAFLDAMPQTSNAKVGTQGYCMGGPLVFQTAGAVPNRIGAVASFHGGGLTTKDANSPHLLVEKTNARYLVAVAKNDDANDPTSKTILRETFAKAGRPAVVDVYAGNHGWCVPDGAVYMQSEAERAWSTLLSVYKTSLV
jgi:carboxymethylenebutenolidase